MRPVKLTMSAFIAYEEENVVIDFEKLGTSGLYLITGDTGSGKTTIFDAITFALFGEASSKRRGNSLLRSKSAPDDRPTRVELVFAYRDKEYTIERSPSYSVPSRKTPVPPKVKLTLPDGTSKNTAKEADAKIKDLFGINSDQFCRIAMIAQNDYLKILDDDKEGEIRKKLFREVFGTEKYGKLQEELGKKLNDKNKEYEAVKSSLKQYAAGIKCADEHPLSETIKKACGEAGEFKSFETIAALKQLISEDTANEEALTKETEDIEKQETALTKLLTKAGTWDTARTSLETANHELNEKNKLTETLHIKTEEARKKAQQAEGLHKEIGELTAKLPAYRELDEKEEAHKRLETELQTDGESLKKAEEKAKEKASEQSKLETERKSLENAAAEKVKQEAKRDEISQSLRKLKNLKKDLINLGNKKTDLIKKQQLVCEKRDLWKQKKEVYDTQLENYVAGQAGLLAENLTEGKACPVCGNTTHPHLATKMENVPTEEILKATKKASDQAESEMREVSQEADKDNTVIKEKEKQLMKTLGELGFGEFANEDVTQLTGMQEVVENEEKSLQTELFENNTAVRKAENDTCRKEEIETTELPGLKKECENLRSLIGELKTSIEVKKEQKDSCEKRMKELKQEIKFPGETEAKAEIKRLEDEIKKAQDRLDDATKQESECNERITELKTKINEANEILKDAQDVDTQKERERQTAFAMRKKDLKKYYDECHARLENNRGALKNIEKTAEKMQRAADELVILKDLSNTANGSINQTDKIELEVFSQMFYLDNVIISANRRLLKMSNGRFELVRRKVAARKQGKTGLDFDVIDHYEGGAQTSVASLSGGESFQASLAFQIGLADAIQAYAGGIQIDTLFVDEGFGTQSEEALNQVIGELIKLNDGNKLVGIISHVPELKNRIDKQIVTKSEGGANSVEVVV